MRALDAVSARVGDDVKDLVVTAGKLDPLLNLFDPIVKTVVFRSLSRQPSFVPRHLFAEVANRLIALGDRGFERFNVVKSFDVGGRPNRSVASGRGGVLATAARVDPLLLKLGTGRGVLDRALQFDDDRIAVGNLVFELSDPFAKHVDGSQGFLLRREIKPIVFDGPRLFKLLFRRFSHGEPSSKNNTPHFDLKHRMQRRVGASHSEEFEIPPRPTGV